MPINLCSGHAQVPIWSRCAAIASHDAPFPRGRSGRATAHHRPEHFLGQLAVTDLTSHSGRLHIAADGPAEPAESPHAASDPPIKTAALP